jgi:hypothetical protein
MLAEPTTCVARLAAADQPNLQLHTSTAKQKGTTQRGAQAPLPLS